MGDVPHRRNEKRITPSLTDTKLFIIAGNKVNRKASEVEEGQDRSSLASSDCEKKKTVHFESSSSIFTNFLRSGKN